MGLITREQLVELAPNAKQVSLLVEAINTWLPKYDITGLRFIHFIAQTAHESGRFVYYQEIWGPTRQQQKYDSPINGSLARQLGNIMKGDGSRFRGRGPLQLTGRGNYKKRQGLIQTLFGVDILKNPELVARADIGIVVACEYWKDRQINRLADKDDVEAVTRAINGGMNGYLDRVEMTKKAKEIWGYVEKVG